MRKTNVLLKSTMITTLLLSSTLLVTTPIYAHTETQQLSYKTLNDLLTEDGHSGWSYSGLTGPEYWGELNEDYKACSKGEEQSPIALQNEDIDNEKWSFDLDYEETEFSIENNGHTIQANVEGSSSNTLLLNDTEYNLVQFHFHSPSEHTLDDEYFEMEVHLVHQDEHANLAVLGVLIEEGEQNETLTDMWELMPGQQGEAAERITLNPSELVPSDLSTFQYDGSLTTPPCSEDVKWSVSDSTISLSPEQLEAFQDLYPNNYRPIQDLGNREVGFHY